MPPMRRYLTFVRNAFAGTPTLLQEFHTPEELKATCATSDILYVLSYFI